MLPFRLSMLVKCGQEERQRLLLAFPKVADLKLPEAIEVIAGELCKVGVSTEGELKLLNDKDFKKLSLKPASQDRIKELATNMAKMLDMSRGQDAAGLQTARCLLRSTSGNP